MQLRPDDQQLTPFITSPAQRFFDEPVYVEISAAKPLALAVNQAAQQIAVQQWRKPSRGPVILPVITDIDHYERVQLRWMKPDGKGGLVPKYEH